MKSPRQTGGVIICKKDFTTLADESIIAEKNPQEAPMENTDKQARLNELYQLIAEIRDPEDVRILFEDLCTRKEVENMAERVFAARLLMEGNTYNQVMAQADISSATLSRVSRCVQYGSGYSKLLKKE
jgi:TrpR-related protein YerC/YecD